VFAMTTDEMQMALANSGNVASSAAASIEHALERDPVMRFLLETYQEGIERIQARELFKAWCSWCAEVRHESGSSTRFGGLVKKALVEGVTVGGDRWSKGVAVRTLKGRKLYTVTPMKDFPLGAYFGVVTVNPHPLSNPHPNYHPENQPEGKEFEQRGDSGDSSFLKLKRLENIYIEPIKDPICTKETLCASQPSPLSPQPPLPTLNGHAEIFWKLVRDNPNLHPHLIGLKFYGETRCDINGQQVKALIAQGPPPDPFALTTANEIF